MNDTKFVVTLVIILVLAVALGYFIFQTSWHKQDMAIQEEELDQYSADVESIYRQIRGIRHDYRNHLQVMQAYLVTNQLQDLELYIRELNNELNQVDTIIRTGNTLIDALVNTKLSKAQELGITIDATALAPPHLNIENVDIATILGNLLSNALEATEAHLRESSVDDRPFIRLYIAPMQSNLYISVTNSMLHQPKEGLLSLKAPNRQGYGIRRIDEKVEKYQGLVNRQWEDGVFATEITLPMSSEK